MQQMCCILKVEKRCVQTVTFEPGKGGHLTVRLGQRFSVLPMHGSNKEIGKGLAEKIKKDLRLK
jgi:mRNA interferase HicA